jgi:hypothetical protein
VEESLGGWVIGEEASVHNPGTEPLETGSTWTSAMRDNSIRFLGDIGDLADIR